MAHCYKKPVMAKYALRYGNHNNFIKIWPCVSNVDTQRSADTLIIPSSKEEKYTVEVYKNNPRYLEHLFCCFLVRCRLNCLHYNCMRLFYYYLFFCIEIKKV